MSLFPINQQKLTEFMDSLDDILNTQVEKKTKKYGFDFNKETPIN